MYRVHIWLRKKDDLSAEEFADHWLKVHAPIAVDGYEHLHGYVVNVVMDAVYASSKSGRWEPVQLEEWRGGIESV